MNPPTASERIDHPSYRRHRRQVWSQILLPVLIAALAFLAAPIVAWVGPARNAAEVGRLAAISTMWILIPVMMGVLILLVLLIGLIFAARQAAAWIPPYSRRAQRITARIADGSERTAEMVRRPTLALRELGAQAKRRLQRSRGRA